jgi:hypothetical protein
MLGTGRAFATVIRSEKPRPKPGLFEAKRQTPTDDRRLNGRYGLVVHSV